NRSATQEDAPLGYARTGAYRDCIKPEANQTISTLDERSLVIRGENTRYLAVVETSCSGAAKAIRYFALPPDTHRLCKGDAVLLVDEETKKAIESCRLATFEILLDRRTQPAHN
ncbi:MAG: hypothetical protein AAGJ87_17080, partial [Pseudomonadota bacterium]